MSQFLRGVDFFFFAMMSKLYWQSLKYYAFSSMTCLPSSNYEIVYLGCEAGDKKFNNKQRLKAYLANVVLDKHYYIRDPVMST
jgi:hypothetical protein